MQEYQYDDIKVRYYELNNMPKDMPKDIDYILAKVEPDNVEKIMKLKKLGFCFHNRTILGEINLDTMDERLLRMVRGDMRIDTIYTEELYELAKKTFVRDRRFHLDIKWDQVLANKVLKGYLNRFSHDDTMLFKCFHNGKTVGFTVVKKLDETLCENVLGAVDPLYQNRGVAIGLYSYMLKELKRKGYKKLYGRISTTNMASINLHIALGAKYSMPEDEYIFRKEIKCV